MESRFFMRRLINCLYKCDIDFRRLHRALINIVLIDLAGKGWFAGRAMLTGRRFVFHYELTRYTEEKAVGGETVASAYNNRMNADDFTTEPKSLAGFEPRVVKLLMDGISQNELDLSTEKVEQLLMHLALLEKWNRRLNLTAIVSPREMVIQHVLDSLSIVNRLSQQDRILDIGTGGGFPGVPLALALPQAEVCLLDARGKRVEFLRYVIGACKISNATAVHTRIEDYQPSQKFDTLVTRAFSSLGDMLTWTAPLHRSAGRLLAMKGKRPDDEIAELPAIWQDRVAVQPLLVPFLDAERHLVEINLTDLPS